MISVISEWVIMRYRHHGTSRIVYRLRRTNCENLRSIRISLPIPFDRCTPCPALRRLSRCLPGDTSTPGIHRSSPRTPVLTSGAGAISGQVTTLFRQAVWGEEVAADKWKKLWCTDSQQDREHRVAAHGQIHPSGFIGRMDSAPAIAHCGRRKSRRDSDAVRGQCFEGFQGVLHPVFLADPTVHELRGSGIRDVVGG